MDNVFLARDKVNRTFSTTGKVAFPQFNNFRVEMTHIWRLKGKTLESQIYFCHPCCGDRPEGGIPKCKCKTYTWDAYYPISIPSSLSRLIFIGGVIDPFDELEVGRLETWLQGAHDYTALEALLPAVEIAEYLHEAFTAAAALTVEDVEYELEL